MPQMLGKLAARYDRRTLKLSRYLAPHLQERPDKSDWLSKVSNWGVHLNNQIGCCAIAMVANSRKSWTTNDAAPVIADPSDDQVLADYQAISGYRPGNPDTDQGCVMLDVLNAWRSGGLCGGHIRAYAQVHAGDIETVLTGCHYFGGLMMGVQLPAAVQGNTESWKAPPAPQQFGEWSPGSWGGHAIFGGAYEVANGRKSSTELDGVLRFVSWGQVIEMSFNFLRSYGDEIYVGVSADYLGPDFTAPSGIDMNLLLSDIGALQQVS